MTLHEFNILPREQLIQELTRCCGSPAWVQKMLPFIPADDMVELLEDVEEQWWKCTEADWKEAFVNHPKIGDWASLKERFADTSQWASDEQSKVGNASEETLLALAEYNKEYEMKFGYIFIVCATGKSAEDIFTILRERLSNDPATEIEIAADEQNKITKLRLEKLLQ